MIRISAKLQNVIVPTTGLGKEDLAEINRVACQGIRKQVIDHFLKMAKATDSQHWWHEAINSIGESTMLSDRCTSVLTVGQKGVRLQWLGGKVLPKGKNKRLLIPFKKRGGTGQDSPILRKSLTEWKTQNNIPEEEICVLPSQTGKAPVMYWKRKNKDGINNDMTPLGVLLRSATIKPKPQVMPTDAEMTDAARSAVVSYTRAINHRNTIQP